MNDPHQSVPLPDSATYTYNKFHIKMAEGMQIHVWRLAGGPSKNWGPSVCLLLQQQQLLMDSAQWSV